MRTPDRMVVPAPIQTSCPMMTSPLVAGCPTIFLALSLNTENGYVVIQSVRWLPPRNIVTPAAIEQKDPTWSVAGSPQCRITGSPYVPRPTANCLVHRLAVPEKTFRMRRLISIESSGPADGGWRGNRISRRAHRRPPRERDPRALDAQSTGPASRAATPPGSASAIQTGIPGMTLPTTAVGLWSSIVSRFHNPASLFSLPSHRFRLSPGPRFGHGRPPAPPLARCEQSFSVGPKALLVMAGPRHRRGARHREARLSPRGAPGFSGGCFRAVAPRSPWRPRGLAVRLGEHQRPQRDSSARKRASE